MNSGSYMYVLHSITTPIFPLKDLENLIKKKGKFQILERRGFHMSDSLNLETKPPPLQFLMFLKMGEDCPKNEKTHYQNFRNKRNLPLIQLLFP